MFAPIRTERTTLLLALCFRLVSAVMTVNAAAPGSVVAWGANGYGQAIVPAGLSGVTAIAGGYHSMALKNDGTLVAWGANGAGETDIPAGLSGVVAIAAGMGHSVALISDGTVVAWGLNDCGQTNVPAGLSGVTAIAAGLGHTVALKSDGTVVAWGDNRSGQTSVPAGLSDVVAIGAGTWHSVALKRDGTVAAWKFPVITPGAVPVPSGLSNVVAIATGGHHVAALKSDGTVVQWGNLDNYGPGTVPVPVGLSGVKAVAAGFAFNVALKTNGTVVAWGDNTESQTNVPAGLGGVTAIAAGVDHTMGILGIAPAIAPTIIRQTANQTVTAGQNVSFSVTATGTAPFSYQWRKDGVNLADQTGAVLTLTNVVRGQSGLYSVTVTNAAGTVTSGGYRLRVLVPQRLQPPEPLGSGQFRLRFGDSDGGTLTTNDLPGFEVWGTTNLSNTNAWVRVTNGVSVTNGHVQVDDADSPSLPRRFYRVIER